MIITLAENQNFQLPKSQSPKKSLEKMGYKRKGTIRIGRDIYPLYTINGTPFVFHSCKQNKYDKKFNAVLTGLKDMDTGKRIYYLSELPETYSETVK